MGLNKRLISQEAAAAGVINTDNFAPVLYTGNGGTQSISSLDFQPDLVWMKDRGRVREHIISDSVRGTSKELSSDTTDAEESRGVSAFNSNGFSFSDGNTNYNESSQSYVAWCWKGGGSAVSNTDGTITSQVSANQDAGFSIVKYTGNGSTSATVGHGLSTTPDMIMLKDTSAIGSWNVAHIGLTTGYQIYLNSTAAQTNSLGSNGGLVQGDQTATYFGFSSGTLGVNNVNANGNNYIAYCFHSVDGYQKVGTYTGTGQPNNDVTTGFKPRWVMIKNTSGEGWNIVDSVRNPSNPANLNIQANSNAAESSTGNPAVQVDFDDTGFSLVAPAGTPGEGQVNSNGSTYIYLAIA